METRSTTTSEQVFGDRMTRKSNAGHDMNQDPSTNITYVSLHPGTEHGVLHPCRWSFQCAPDTSDKQVSAYSALRDSTKIAQVMLSIFPSFAMTGAELPPPF